MCVYGVRVGGGGGVGGGGCVRVGAVSVFITVCGCVCACFGVRAASARAVRECGSVSVCVYVH